MKTKELTVYLTNGATFRFYDVEIQSGNISTMTFHYTSASDGKKKTARFDKTKVAGTSTEVEAK